MLPFISGTILAVTTLLTAILNPKLFKLPVRTAITTTPIGVQPLLEWAKDPHAGAVVLFLGTTRDSFEGKRVAALSYDCHVPMAERSLERIAEEAAAHPGVMNVALVHRIGLVPLTEESVAIVVASAHRRQGWDTAEWILEEVKRSVEIWKREEYTDGSNSWIAGLPRN